MTEDVQNGFPDSEPQPWLRGVPDPYDQGPLHSWRITMSFASAATRLSGLVRGSFRGIEVLRRGYSPRIVSARVLGSQGATEVSGPELAARLGLTGTWAYFSVAGARGVHREPDLSHYSAPRSPSGGETPAPPPKPEGGGAPAGQSTPTQASDGGSVAVVAGEEASARSGGTPTG
jgi:stage II sporulation protein D